MITQNIRRHRQHPSTMVVLTCDLLALIALRKRNRKNINKKKICISKQYPLTGCIIGGE